MHHSRYSFTIIELLVSVAIIAILFSLLMPAFSESREKARFVRWLQFNKQCSNDPTCVINLNFQDDIGGVLKNSAQAYPADGFNATDYSGTVKGNYEWGSGRWKKGKQAIQFDGMSTYIEFSGTEYVNFDVADDFTIIVWVKFDIPSDKKWSGIFSKSYVNASSPGYSMSLIGKKPTGNKIANWADVDIDSVQARFRNVPKGGNKPILIDDTSWFQLAVRNKKLNGKQVISIFINDVALEPKSSNISVASSKINTGGKCAARFALGGIRYQKVKKNKKTKVKELTQDGKMKTFFKGKMDELLVYSRALKDSEIKAHYLMGDVHGN